MSSLASELNAAIDQILRTRNASKLDDIPGLRITSKKHIPGKSRGYAYQVINEPRVEIHFNWEMYCGHLWSTYKILGLTFQEEISLRMEGVVLERPLKKDVLAEISFTIEQLLHAWDESKLGNIPYMDFVEGDLSGTERWHKHRMISAPQLEILCRWDGRYEPTYRIMGADDIKVDLMLNQRRVSSSIKNMLEKMGVLFKELTFQERRPCAIPHLPPRYEATINGVLYRWFEDETGMNTFMWGEIP